MIITKNCYWKQQPRGLFTKRNYEKGEIELNFCPFLVVILLRPGWLRWSFWKLRREAKHGQKGRRNWRTWQSRVLWGTRYYGIVRDDVVVRARGTYLCSYQMTGLRYLGKGTRSQQLKKIKRENVWRDREQWENQSALRVTMLVGFNRIECSLSLYEHDLGYSYRSTKASAEQWTDFDGRWFGHERRPETHRWPRSGNSPKRSDKLQYCIFRKRFPSR